MAHFAQLDVNNIVLDVLVVDNADIVDPNTGQESEAIGVAFLQALLGADTMWKQTSYNGNFRAYYAGIGYSYDPIADVFVPPIDVDPEP